MSNQPDFPTLSELLSTPWVVQLLVLGFAGSLIATGIAGARYGKRAQDTYSILLGFTLIIAGYALLVVLILTFEWA